MSKRGSGGRDSLNDQSLMSPGKTNQDELSISYQQSSVERRSDHRNADLLGTPEKSTNKRGKNEFDHSSTA